MEKREEQGPFDDSEIPGVKIFVDLGGIKVPPREGLFMRLEFDEATNQAVALGLDYMGSTLQVQAFAAPRNSGLWDQVRNHLRNQLVEQGAQVVEERGNLGKELRAIIPILMSGEQIPETRQTRIVGVDGPRWFLRGIIVGDALKDDAAAADIEDLFRSLVVVRGNAPMPPQEMIPLRMPLEVNAQVTQSSFQV